MKYLILISLLIGGIVLSGCVTSIGLKVLYREAPLAPSQITKNICYESDGECKNSRHHLDLYAPDGKDWPVMIFVHGGGWNSGDKDLKVKKADVYANIGRYYAARGIGVAVINYGLQPGVTWDRQVADVESAVAWVRANIQDRGGNPDQVFLMGHSAGAYLASYAALRLSQNEKTPYLRGVIAVSGAALDMVDQKTYEMGERVEYYQQRFQGSDTTENWKKDASPSYQATKNAPPFLIIYGGKEKVTLQRQSLLLNNAISEKGVPCRVIKEPGQYHSWMVLALTREDRMSAPAVVEFIRGSI